MREHALRRQARPTALVEPPSPYGSQERSGPSSTQPTYLVKARTRPSIDYLTISGCRCGKRIARPLLNGFRLRSRPVVRRQVMTKTPVCFVVVLLSGAVAVALAQGTTESIVKLPD